MFAVTNKKITKKASETMINIEIADSKNCNGDYSLFITFDYNSAIVETIKAFPTRFWDKENKSWEVPFNKLGEVVNKLSALGDITISGKYIKLDTDEVQIPKDYVFKTKPFEHQIDGVKFGLNHNKWLLGDEQGLGKTKQVIDIAEIKKVKHCLIVCCVNGLKWNWKNEVATHSNDNAWILGQHTNSCGMYIGSNADRLEDLNHIDELPRFIITNIETLRYKVKTGRKVMQKVNGRLKEVDEYAFPITERLQKLCKSGEIEMIAVDEFHKCFDYDTEITTNLGKLKIGDIVTNKTHCSVLSYNEQTNELEWKPITNWFANKVKTPMIELTLQRENGEIKTLKCTLNHKIYTSNRGWVSASELTEEDDIVENLAFM